MDRVVEDGESEVDDSMVTGESLPVHKTSGSEVIGATINTDGTLRARATKSVCTGRSHAALISARPDAVSRAGPSWDPAAISPALVSRGLTN